MPGAEGWSNRLTSRFWDGGNLLPRWRRHRLALKTETLVVEVASLLCTVHCSKYMPSSMSSEPYPVKGWPIAISPYCRPITLDGFAPTLTMATSWKRWYLLRCQLLHGRNRSCAGSEPDLCLDIRSRKVHCTRYPVRLTRGWCGSSWLMGPTL